MKAKIFMGIIIGCLSVALLGLLVSQRVQADTSATGPWLEGVPKDVSVSFAEDFMKEHGKQVMSYCVLVDNDVPTLIDTIPENKRFIVTDIISYDNTAVFLLSDTEGLTRKTYWSLTASREPHLSLHSGIVFESGESILIRTPDIDTTVTISGYYVDLP